MFIRTSSPYLFLKEKYFYINAFTRWKINGFSKEVGVKPVFVFNHIPKCAGVSLLNLFKNWFHIIRDYSPSELKIRDEFQLEKFNKDFEKNIPNLQRTKPWQMIAGHYHLPRFSLMRRIPEIYLNENVRAITFLRDPLSQRISMYYYAKKQGHPFINGFTLHDYLMEDKNFISNTLYCNEKNYKEIIDSYFFVGVLEKFDVSIEKLLRKIGIKSKYKLPKLNVNRKSEGMRGLGEVEIEKFRKNNQLDYMIYNYVLLKYYSN